MLRLLPLVVAVLLVTAARSSGEERHGPAAAPDRAAARTSLLRRLHHQADEASGLAHLAARVAADEALPLPYLGVDADPDAASRGMRITRVYPATAAEASGLAVDDVILSVDGAETHSAEALGRIVRGHEPGARLALRVKRGAEERSVGLVLGQRPEDNDDVEEAVPMHGSGHGAAAAVRLAFDAEQPGETPASLDVVLGGHGDAPSWIVAQDGGGVFLRQAAADITGIRYPMAWSAEFHARDVQARVRFRLVSGKQDRAAGIIVRGQDRWTYLVARVNGAEGDLCLFRCAHGRRQLLPGGRIPVQVKPDAWHVLEVKADGARITASLDGAAEVSSHDTYVRGWHVGLWTKSDSVTDFDDFTAQGLARDTAR
jgi:hypothetical protein